MKFGKGKGVIREILYKDGGKGSVARVAVSGGGGGGRRGVRMRVRTMPLGELKPAEDGRHGQKASDQGRDEEGGEGEEGQQQEHEHDRQNRRTGRVQRRLQLFAEDQDMLLDAAAGTAAVGSVGGGGVGGRGRRASGRVSAAAALRLPSMVLHNCARLLSGHGENDGETGSCELVAVIAAIAVIAVDVQCRCCCCCSYCCCSCLCCCC